MTALMFVGVVAIGYLLGAIPFGVIISKRLAKADVREVGSGKIGMTNVLRAAGKKAAISSLLFDIVTGVLAVVIAGFIFRNTADTYAVILTLQESAKLLAGLAAIAGHSWSIFLKFRGGKGGATAVGILALLMPKAIPVAVGIFILALLLTKYPTFSYALALLWAPFAAWVAYDNGKWVIFSVILLVMVLIKYTPRLLEMRNKGGNWKRVFIRKGLKDRF